MTPLWRYPGTVALHLLGIAALAGLAWWWLSINETDFLRSAVSLLLPLAIAAGFILLARRARQTLRDTNRPRSAAAIAAALVLFAASLAAAYGLIWWIPQFPTLRMQAASAVARFGLAYLLVVLCWLNLLGTAPAGTPRSIHETTAASPN